MTGRKQSGIAMVQTLLYHPGTVVVYSYLTLTEMAITRMTSYIVARDSVSSDRLPSEVPNPNLAGVYRYR